MSYEFGVDVLGAGPTGSLTPLQQLMQIPPTQPAMMQPQQLTQAQVLDSARASQAQLFDSAFSNVRPMQRQFDEQSEANKRMARNIFVGGVIGGTIGSLALGVGGAYLWPAHRILGFFLGSFVGWPMGSVVGGTIGAAR
jgi:hypothetical protein